MRYKQLSILLLLQIFLFIQCTTAETSNDKKKKNNKVTNSFIDTNNLAAAGNPVSASKQNTKAVTNQEIKRQNFKQIQFGFNMGYLSGLQNKDFYIKALTQIKNDGITNLRIYEPFNKAVSKNPELISAILKPATTAGFKFLLCFSNFPTDSSASIDNQPTKADHADELKFTNRYAPSDLNRYGAVLTRILNNLKSENIIQNLSFEIGNEPDAKKYFWSDAASFNRVARLAKSILVKYNQPVYCCGFATEFAVNSKAYDKNFLNLIDDNSFFNDVNLSFHFYPNQKYEFSNISLPRTSNAIISEFNIYSYQKQSNQNRIDYTNSAAIGKWMSELLEFTYNNNIHTVYLFNLIDDPKKNGALGFFDASGNPKPSYNYFIKFYNVIRDGYKVEKNNNTVKIIGKQQTIVYTPKNTNFRNNRNNNNNALSPNKNQDANAWKIVNN